MHPGVGRGAPGHDAGSNPARRDLGRAGGGVQPGPHPDQGHVPGASLRRPGAGVQAIPGLPAQPGAAHSGRGPTHPGPSAQRPPNLAPPGDWNRALRGADRDRAGQQWRQRHDAWQDHAPWRRDPNWWRRDRAFRLFLGPRLGFFFIPDLGYISVPSQYESRHWIEGEYLPSWFWRYIVRDYRNYGLPDPPIGCVWVWVGNDVALIDQRDGYILEIVHNVW